MNKNSKPVTILLIGVTLGLLITTATSITRSFAIEQVEIYELQQQ